MSDATLEVIEGFVMALVAMVLATAVAYALWAGYSSSPDGSGAARSFTRSSSQEASTSTQIDSEPRR